jgi:hypothetical protein
MLSVIDELCMPAYINVRSFHWIMIIIQVDHGRVDIMNSSDKSLEDYSNLLDMLQR